MPKVGDKIKILPIKEILKRNLIRECEDRDYCNPSIPYGIPMESIRFYIDKMCMIEGLRVSFRNDKNIDYTIKIIGNCGGADFREGYAWPSDWFVSENENGQMELDFLL